MSSIASGFSSLADGAAALLDGYVPIDPKVYSGSTGHKGIVLTQYAMCASSWLGTISVVASVALGNLAITLAAVYATLTALVASHYIKRTYAEATIESDVASLRQVNDGLNKDLEGYKKQVEELNTSLGTFKKENADLAKANQDAKAISAELSKTVVKLEKTNKETQAQIESFLTVPTKIAQLMDSFGKNVSTIQASANVLDDATKKQLKETSDNITKQTDLLGKMKVTADSMEPFLKQCQGILQSVTQIYQQSIDTLKKTVEADKQIQDEFQKWKIAEIEKNQEDMAAILDQLNKTLDNAFNEMKQSQSVTGLGVDGHQHTYVPTTLPIQSFHTIHQTITGAVTSAKQNVVDHFKKITKSTQNVALTKL